MRQRRSPVRAGFTLIELLVVIGLIAMLFVLLLPAINYARGAALSSNCRSNLRQIGLAMNMYLDTQNDRAVYPEAAQLPSVTPDKPSLATVLRSFTENDDQVFACPADDEYFPVEGISYEYPTLQVAGRTRREVETSRSYAFTWILFDFDDFHGSAGVRGSRNALYADGHVESY